MKNLLYNAILTNITIILGVIAYEALDAMLYDIKKEIKND